MSLCQLHTKILYKYAVDEAHVVKTSCNQLLLIDYACFNCTNTYFILNGIGTHIVLNLCILLQADFEWNYRTRRDIAAVERNVLLKYADFYLQRCQSERIQSKTFCSPTLISLRDTPVLSACYDHTWRMCSMWLYQGEDFMLRCNMHTVCLSVAMYCAITEEYIWEWYCSLN